MAAASTSPVDATSTAPRATTTSTSPGSVPPADHGNGSRVSPRRGRGDTFIDDIDLGVWSRTLPNVHTLQGARIPVPFLWRKRRIVLAVLPAVEWRAAASLAVHLDSLRPRLLDAGVPLVAICHGSRVDTRKWQEVTEFAGELYVDAESTASSSASGDGASAALREADGSGDRVDSAAQVYETFGLAHLPPSLVPADPDEAAAQAASAVALKAAGFAGNDPSASPSSAAALVRRRQLGGVFVMGPGGTCDYVYRCAYQGDEPPLQNVLSAALGRARAVGGAAPVTAESVPDAFVDDDDDDDADLEPDMVGGSGGSGTEDGTDTEGDTAWGNLPVGSSGYVFPSTHAWTSALDVTQKRGGVATCEHFAFGDDVAYADASLSGARNLVATAVAVLILLVLSVLWTRSASPGVGLAGSGGEQTTTLTLAAVGVAVVVFVLTRHGGSALRALWRSLCARGTTPPGKHSRRVSDADVDIDRLLPPLDWRGLSDRQTAEMIAAVPRVQLLSALDIDELTLKTGVWESECMPSGDTSGSGSGGGGAGSTAFHAASPMRGARVATGSPGSAQRAECGAAELLHYRELLRFCRGFLAKSHRRLVGRPGPVCPYAAHLLASNQLVLSVVPASSLPKKRVMRAAVLTVLVRRLAEAFQARATSSIVLDAAAGAGAGAGAGSEAHVRHTSSSGLVLMVPGLPRDACGPIGQRVEADCFSDLLQAGVVLGAFHPDNDTRGQWNKRVHPMRAPWLCFVLRPVVTADVRRLTDDHIAAAIPARARVGLYRAYLLAHDDGDSDGDRDDGNAGGGGASSGLEWNDMAAAQAGLIKAQREAKAVNASAQPPGASTAADTAKAKAD